MLESNQTTHVFLILLIFFASGCSKKAADEIDFGTITDSVYENKYFQLAMTIPEEWNILDHKTQQEMMARGTEVIAGDDKNLKATVKASEMRTVNLLSAFKHPQGSAYPVLPNRFDICQESKPGMIICFMQRSS